MVLTCPSQKAKHLGPSLLSVTLRQDQGAGTHWSVLVQTLYPQEKTFTLRLPSR